MAIISWLIYPLTLAYLSNGASISIGLQSKSVLAYSTIGVLFVNCTCLSHLVLVLLGNILILMVGVGAGTRGFPLDDGDLHVLDLDPHQQEVDLTDYHVLVKSIN